MGKLGLQELLIILVLVLVVFGGGKLAGVGKALGGSIRDFKNEIGKKDEKKDDAVKAEATPEDKEGSDK